MVRVRFELSRPEFLAVENARVPLWQRWPGWVLLGIFGAICLAVGGFALLAPAYDRSAGSWVLPAVFIVALALGRLERWWRRERAWRVARAIGEIVAEFSDAGLMVAAGPERAFIEWR